MKEMIEKEVETEYTNILDFVPWISAKKRSSQNKHINFLVHQSAFFDEHLKDYIIKLNWLLNNDFIFRDIYSSMVTSTYPYQHQRQELQTLCHKILSNNTSWNSSHLLDSQQQVISTMRPSKWWTPPGLGLFGHFKQCLV